MHEVVVAPDRLEALASSGGASLGRNPGLAELAIGLDCEVAGERREEDHEPPLRLGAIAGPQRGARAVFEAGGQGRGLGAHLGADGAALEELERHVESLGLHRELDLLEVRGDGVVTGNVRADVMRGSGADYCNEYCCSECHEHGYRRGWPETDATRLRSPDHGRHRSAIRRTTNPTSHHRAAMVAEPNGTHTSHSANAFAPSGPYDGINALHKRQPTG